MALLTTLLLLAASRRVTPPRHAGPTPVKGMARNLFEEDTDVPGAPLELVSDALMWVAEEVVDAYNEDREASLELIGVQESSTQVVDGIMYHVLMKTSTGTMHAWLHDTHTSKEYMIQFTSKEQLFWSRKEPKLSSRTSLLEHDASYAKIAPSFDLREAHPQCKKSMEYLMTQGKCASCYAIATVRAIYDTLCIQDHDLFQSLKPAAIHNLMGCSMKEVSSTYSNRMLPFYTHGCEGGVPSDVIDFISKYGLPTGDEQELDAHGATMPTIGVLNLKPDRPRPFLLRCSSDHRHREVTFDTRDDSITLTHGNAHFTRCHDEHKRRGFQYVGYMRFSGLSSLLQCDSSEAQLRHLISFVETQLDEASLKHALRVGPVIVSLEFFDVYDRTRSFYSVYRRDYPYPRIIRSREARSLTREGRRQCERDPNCIISLGVHAVELLGYKADAWIVRNSHSQWGNTDTSIGLIAIADTKAAFLHSYSATLPHGNACGAILTRIIQSTSHATYYLFHFRSSFDQEKQHCIFQNSNAEAAIKVTFFHHDSDSMEGKRTILPAKTIRVKSKYPCCPYRIRVLP